MADVAFENMKVPILKKTKKSKGKLVVDEDDKTTAIGLLDDESDTLEHLLQAYEQWIDAGNKVWKQRDGKGAPKGNLFSSKLLG